MVPSYQAPHARQIELTFICCIWKWIRHNKKKKRKERVRVRCLGMRLLAKDVGDVELYSSELHQV